MTNTAQNNMAALTLKKLTHTILLIIRISAVERPAHTIFLHPHFGQFKWFTLVIVHRTNMETEIKYNECINQLIY